MADVVIQNPVINSPFAEPIRHFEFGEQGITGNVIEGSRRPSSYFVPILHGRRHRESLYSTVSRPFDRPESGRIAVKGINHYGDEVLKVLEV